MNSLKRVLLVEDNLEVANEAKWLLKDTGYLTGGFNNWDLFRSFNLLYRILRCPMEVLWTYVDL